MALFNNKYTLGDAMNGIDYDPVKNESLLIVFDEAKSIPDALFEAFERCHATRWLEASTPDHVAPSGHFYDSFHKDSWRYKTFMVGYEECPHLMNDPVRVREREEQIKKYGIKHPFICSMHFGQFPTTGENMVFDMRKVDEAMSGLLPEFGTRERRAAIDLSGGGNECPMYIRDGNRVRYIDSWYEDDAVALADLLISKFRQFELKPEWIVADSGGLGDPICDILDSKGWPINRIKFGESPRNLKEYANVRTEIYFELSHRINAGEVILPKDDIELKEQLRWQNYISNEKGVLRLVPKKSLPGSPDRGDTIAMLFYDMPRAQRYERDDDLYKRRLSTTMSVDNSYEMDYSYDKNEGILF